MKEGAMTEVFVVSMLSNRRTPSGEIPEIRLRMLLRVSKSLICNQLLVVLL